MAGSVRSLKNNIFHKTQSPERNFPVDSRIYLKDKEGHVKLWLFCIHEKLYGDARNLELPSAQPSM